MKRLAWFTLVVLTTLTMVLLAWELRATLVLFVLSLVTAATVRPLVDRLKAAGVRPGLAVLITYVTCVGSLVVLIWLLIGPLLSDLQQLTSDLVGRLDQIRTQWPQGNLFQQFIAQLASTGNPLSATDQTGNAWLQSFLGMTLSSLDLLGRLIIIVVLSIYWSVDQERFKRLWLSLLPCDMRTRARDVWQTIETGVGAYVRSELIQSLLAAILLAGGYYVIGLKYPIALGVIGAMGWLIPWVGVLLAVVPAFLVGLAMSPVQGLAAAVITLAVLSLLEFVVEPRLFNRRRFSSLLVVIVVLVLADEFGIVGILVAPPLAAALQILAAQFTHSASAVTMGTTNPAREISVLQQRVEALQTRLATGDEPPGPEVVNLVDRLRRLIEQAGEEQFDLPPAARSQEINVWPESTSAAP